MKRAVTRSRCSKSHSQVIPVRTADIVSDKEIRAREIVAASMRYAHSEMTSTVYPHSRKCPGVYVAPDHRLCDHIPGGLVDFNSLYIRVRKHAEPSRACISLAYIP